MVKTYYNNRKTEEMSTVPYQKGKENKTYVFPV